MVFPQTITTQSAKETAEVGQELAHYLRTQNPEPGSPAGRLNNQEEKRGQDRGVTVVCLYGELGSGKTTFTQGFAKELGIATRLLSPTFIIVRRYQLPTPFSYFYHIDLYRMQGNVDVEGLGIADILLDTSTSFVAIEWAEKLGDKLPENRVDIWFKALNDGRHEITIRKFSI